MKSKWLATLGIILLSAALWGCGSNGGSGGSAVTGPGTTPPQELGSASCVICHTAVVAQAWTGSAHDDAAAGCEGCHGGGQFHRGTGPIPVPAPGLAQCGECHDVSRHGGDLTTTVDVIEGFAVTACEDCHYPANLDPAVTTQWAHNPASDINQQWANSAHGGHIASGPATDAIAPGWVHYNWDQVTGTGNRASCQRCHTATGAKNFFEAKRAGTAYVAANNTFPHLEGWTAATGSPQNEMLYCWGCHSDVPSGGLRDPGAIVEDFPGVGTGAPAATVTFPNIFESNICLGCHIGRQVGQNITDSTADFSNRSFINSHYLAAGGTVFNEAGYEYAGQTYNIYGFHKQVGWSNVQGTGDRGPCVTCHMTSAEGHTFEVVHTDGAGVVTSVASTVCGSCHADMTPATLNATKDEFAAALEELRVALANRGVHFFEAHPYFYTAPYVVGGTNTGLTNWDGINVGSVATPITGRGKDVMGAAFNYNLLKHDPGAYAHNSGYALKLIVDSLDFLNDGTVDSDATTRASAAFVLLNQGINIFDTPDYAAIHNDPVADALAIDLTTNMAGAATICSQCHSRAPHFTTTTSGQGSAQYVNPNGSCADCHAGNDIAANADILNQYSQAGHANNHGSFWRGGCGPCHDPGLFINSVPGYTAVTTNATKKVLACNACHTNVATGDIRFELVAGLPIDDYTYSTTSNTVVASLTYTDYGSSVLCVRCHSGRTGNNYAWGEQLTGNQALFGSHYLVAGPMLENKLGYEFAGGGDYDSLGQHKFVGVNNTNGSGTSGPCVTCHMGSGADHTWQPVLKDQNGDIVEIKNADVCATCHTDMTPATLNAEKAAFQADLEVLRLALEAKSIYYNPANANYYQDSAFATQITTATIAYLDTVRGPVSRIDLIGAMFNYRILAYSHQDPGAYVHNQSYARKLLSDSINILDNGVID